MIARPASFVDSPGGAARAGTTAQDARCSRERPPSIGHRLPWRGALLVALAATGLAACLVVLPIPHNKDIGQAVNIDPADVGVMTQEEVLARWGEPFAVLKNERVFAYAWGHEGWTWCIGVIKTGSGGSACEDSWTTRLMLIQFDEAGRVRRYEESYYPVTADSTPTKKADPPKPEERVVVLPISGDDEQVGMDCVCRAVAHRSSIPAAEFRMALSPWLEPGSLPKSGAELADLLDRGSVRETIALMGVRYLIVMSGETRFTGGSAGGLGVAAFGAGSSMSSSLWFRVWDLASVKSLGSTYATATGDVGGGAVLLIPVATWAPTEAATCKEITWRLSAIFEPGH